MKLPNSLQYCKWSEGLTHSTEESIIDFTGYREIKVRRADPDMIDATAKNCIGNSIEFGETYNLDVVQGYGCIDPVQPKFGFFHYWNYDPETAIYWDITPHGAGKLRYFIKDIL